MFSFLMHTNEFLLPPFRFPDPSLAVVNFLWSKGGGEKREEVGGNSADSTLAGWEEEGKNK